MITKTFEPIRPIWLSDDGKAGFAHALLDRNTGRVFYGCSDWPSRSWMLITWPEEGWTW